VRHAIALLREEIHRNMALLGINTLAEMTPDRLMRMNPNGAQT
jgi:isopentenyl diphosphate isomerase/L-lactate dehydrogenase-like FMN-dependent dehydrogenase